MRLFNKFFPSVQDEKAIACDIITSNVNHTAPGTWGDDGESVSIPSSEKDKVIKWLSEALKLTLKIPVYKEMAWYDRREVRYKIASALAHFSPKASYKDLLVSGNLLPSKFQNSPLVYFSYQTTFREIRTEHNILVNPDITDDIAIKELKGGSCKF
jgi:hypothetical protein